MCAKLHHPHGRISYLNDMETLGIHAHGQKSVVYNGLNFVRDDKSGYYRAHEFGRSKPWLLHRYVMYVAGIEIGKNCEVHHIDGDRSNNLISNLEVMDAIEHKKKHAETMSDELRQWRRDNMLTNAIPSARAWHRTEEGHAWHVQHGKEVAKAQSQVVYDCVCKCCNQPFQCTAKKSDYCSNACKAKYRRDQGVDDIEATCSYCGHTFKRNKYALRKKLEKGENVYCSIRCATRALGDRRHEEFVKKSGCVS